MTFYEYLKDTFGVDEPIYIEKIKYKDYSRAWISKELKKLVDKEEIKRFDRGIYYIPTQRPWGGTSTLDSNKIVIPRFITDGNDIYGYVSGWTLLNKTALTTQVPCLFEVVTNRESTRVRDIHLGNRRIRARRSRTTITKDNVRPLQFLELMNLITPSHLDEDERYMLSKFIQRIGVTKEQVSKYAGLFPAKATQNMIESGAYDELAQG